MTWNNPEAGVREGCPMVNSRMRSTADSGVKRKFRENSHDPRAYSAAAANVGLSATKEGLVFAADRTKSDRRGTISDLNREPLKTP